MCIDLAAIVLGVPTIEKHGGHNKGKFKVTAILINRALEYTVYTIVAGAAITKRHHFFRPLCYIVCVSAKPRHINLPLINAPFLSQGRPYGLGV